MDRLLCARYDLICEAICFRFFPILGEFRDLSAALEHPIIDNETESFLSDRLPLSCTRPLFAPASYEWVIQIGLVMQRKRASPVSGSIPEAASRRR